MTKSFNSGLDNNLSLTPESILFHNVIPACLYLCQIPTVKSPGSIITSMAQLQDWFHKYNGYSFTRHRLYKLCKRAFYNRYIARYLVEPGEISVPKLKRLGGLESRYMLAGKLVHDIIEKQIKTLTVGGEMDPEGARNELYRKVDATRELAGELLTEHYNGLELDPEFFERSKEKGRTCLNSFYNEIWPPVVKRDYLEHEEFESFDLMDVRVVLKTDYVSSQPGGLVVVTDWKTGSPESDVDYKFQVAIYLLWAMDKYERPFEQVRGELAYLSEGYILPVSFNAEQLESYGEMIVDGFNEMNRDYDIGCFETAPSPGKCISCQFAEVCEESQHMQYLEHRYEDGGPDGLGT